MNKVKLTKYEYRTLRAIAETDNPLPRAKNPIVDSLLHHSFIAQTENRYSVTDNGRQWLQAYDERKARRLQDNPNGAE
jgi:hypothetical protein